MSILKSTLIASASLLIAISHANAAENPDTGWYVGAGVAVNQLKDDDGSKETYNGPSFNAGYQLNQHLALELGISGFDSKQSSEDVDGSYKAETDVIFLTPAVKWSYAASERINLYSKVGASIAFVDYQNTNVDDGETWSNKASSEWDVSPMISVGAEWELDSNWAVNAEYTYRPTAIDVDMELDDGSTFSHDLDLEVQSFTLGVNYRF
ncbi:opacity protein-like surface antigen [Sinobacterium caligoides]|uniref:Opacity protein-like surface antigen n=1 Tax=Sinobacterium caligoides TaxID=933926 RepID=A0A3N2DPL0_9GAMM|nr:porin family protein [Sinobacterium caligoides]ROS01758.1 opacity protein-like surface antigen [Sinobacterium caligoides]